MKSTNRREFLRASSAAALSTVVPAELLAQAVTTPPPSGAPWDSGSLRHLLPTVSDSRILIKTSFDAPLADAPTLHVGGTSVRGRMGDTRGEHWHFYATGLEPGRSHRLSLVGAAGRALCEPWELATFPASRHAAGNVPSSHLYLRGRSRDRTHSCRPRSATGCSGERSGFGPTRWSPMAIMCIGTCSRR